MVRGSSGLACEVASSNLLGILRALCLRTDPRKVRVSKHDEGDMAKPADPTAHFI